MEEARFQYHVDAELQPYNCSCPLSATYSTGGALCLQQESSCLYSCTTDCNYDSSTNSTPFVSAPSSPRKSTPFAALSDSARATLAAPSSGQRARDVAEYDALSAAYAEADHTSATKASSPSLSDFEFSSRLSEADAWFNPSSVSPPMSTAEELFYNGKIKPLNTILCSSASHCIGCFRCFSDAVFDNKLYGYQDPANSFKGYTEHLPPSQHAEHHQQQHPLMRKQRSSRHAKPTSRPSALEQWKKSMGRYEKGHARPYAHGQHVEKVMQISSLPLAHYSRKSRCDRGHHRRARSMSPMRVFHIDEKMMQARASFESDMHTTKKISHTAAVDGATTILTKPQRSRKSWTLKELLNMGDNRAHNKRCPAELRVNGAECVKCGSASSECKCKMEEIEANLVKNAKDNVGKRSLEEKRWHRKSGTHSEGASSPWKLQQAEQKQYADQQYPCTIESEEGQVEEMGKWNFLHHKKGWLGCLGFTDNSTKDNSIKGLQSCIT